MALTIPKKWRKQSRKFMVTAGEFTGKALHTLLETPLSAGRLLADNAAHIWFGYYDTSPQRGDLMLAHRADIAASASPHDHNVMAQVGYFDLRDATPAFHRMGETASWNWQQGSRLQWLPGEVERLIYNVFESGRYASVITDLAGRQTMLPHPVYKVSPQGDYALSLNFARLHRLRRGYGYHQLPDSTHADNAPANDGLWRVDMATGEAELLFSLQQLAAISPLPSMAGAVHYLNHLDISPGGKRILFLHLWQDDAGQKRARVCISDMSGSYLDIPVGEGHASHHAWLGDDRLVVFCRRAQTGLHYHLFDLVAGAVEVIAPDLREDGHPTFLPDGRMLTDTYPSLLRLQHVYLHGAQVGKAGKAREIGRFYMPPVFTGEMRCDLHPRLNHDATHAIIDRVVHGRRAMTLLPLS